MGENIRFPHKNLGNKLRGKREEAHESLAEVSGAVEIDIETLSKIEQGMMLPSEDILLLLINHLSVEEEEAGVLWELAGYDHKKSMYDTPPESDQAKQVFMVIPFDNRVLYSDNLQVTTNSQGVVLSFKQTADNQSTTIARIGVSKDCAQSMINIMALALEQKDLPQRMLPKPVDTQEK